MLLFVMIQHLEKEKKQQHEHERARFKNDTGG